jgi:S-adenosylmethionine decarboxylase
MSASNINSLIVQQPTSLCGFEGPEKLLEIWFTRPSHWKDRDHRLNTDNGSDVSDENEKVGLRSIEPSVWHDMLKIVQCQVLSTTHNEYCDAYLLSESSMFVYSNRLMLKTCGTTTLLHSVPRILEIASQHCKLNNVDAIFYSRKAFLFPDKQEFPHGKWGDEVEYLDKFFPENDFDTAGYVIGKVNGDHWCLYVATPLSIDSDGDTRSIGEENVEDEDDDVTLEILMQDLNPEAMKAFWRTPEEEQQAKLPHNVNALKHQFKDNHRLYVILF